MNEQELLSAVLASRGRRPAPGLRGLAARAGGLLDLSANAMGDEGVLALTSSAHLSRLEGLVLDPLQDVGVLALIEGSPACTRCASRATAWGQALSRCWRARVTCPRCVELGLQGNRMSPESRRMWELRFQQPSLPER